ncbi:MAG: adenylate/guanylate cyclase domain-containing protein [Bacteroidota bacterium]
MPQSRRLAAIMFADIAGYTAMMQRNEKEGLKKVHRFSEVMEAQASANKGEILEFRGDGCLAVFNSAVEAMHAAKAIQESLKEEPKVPLRIGIHIGDIVFTDGNIYGDGVNLASRVESMGVPGSILVTERVIHDVKSHPEFEMASLGKFQFKNVEKPMEVFALANEGFVVPKKQEMKGKGEKISRKNRKLRISLGLVSFLLICLAIGLWKGNLSQADKAQATKEQFAKARIAILPFTNKTGKQELEYIGEFTADWLLTQIMRLNSIEVVTLPTVKEHLEYAGSGSRPVIDASFYDRTGAEKLIRGNYYLEGDSLVFNCQVEDVKMGKMDLALPMVKGDLNDLGKSVQEFSTKILTYLFLDKRDDYGFASILEKNPPDFDAYQDFIKSSEYFGTDYETYYKKMEDIMRKDPDFFMPYLQYGFGLSNTNRMEELDSLIKIMETRLKLTTRNDQLYFDMLKKLAIQDLQAVYTIMKEIFAMDPKNPHNNYLTAKHAINLNLPAQGISFFSHISPKHFPTEYHVNAWWFDMYAIAYMRVGKADSAQYILSHIPDKIQNPNSYGLLLQAYLLLGQQDSIGILWKNIDRLNFNPQEKAIIALELANDYGLYAKDKRAQMKWANVALEILDKHQINDHLLRAIVNYLLENWELAAEMYEIEATDYESISWWHLGPMAISYMKAGNEPKFQKWLKIIQEGSRKGVNQAEFVYCHALIKAQQGEKQKAVELLREAFMKGMPYGGGEYDNCFELLPLHGYPAYEEFVKPKG